MPRKPAAKRRPAAKAKRKATTKVLSPLAAIVAMDKDIAKLCDTMAKQTEKSIVTAKKNVTTLTGKIAKARAKVTLCRERCAKAKAKGTGRSATTAGKARLRAATKAFNDATKELVALQASLATEKETVTGLQAERKKQVARCKAVAAADKALAKAAAKPKKKPAKRKAKKVAVKKVAAAPVVATPAPVAATPAPSDASVSEAIA